MCSLAARGLWIEMLALMHEANPRGHLLVNGIAPSDAQLSALIGSPLDQSLITELEQVGVFSRTEDGTIYSRRMTRDEEKAVIYRANGCQGGRPTNPKENQTTNQTQNQKPNTQIPEARNQSLDKKILRPKRKSVSYQPEFKEFWKGYPSDANMSKLQAYNEWILLSDEDKNAATASLVAFRYYCKRNPDYRPVHANRYLKHRRFDGHLKAAAEVREKTKPQIKLCRGTPPFEAWQAYRKQVGQPPINTPEWWFPSEYPPGHPSAAQG